MKQNTKFYKVTAKCGHVGKHYYLPIEFAIYAENGKMAAKIARNKSRVKHHQKDAILNVKEIDYLEYLELLEQNKNNPYLNSHSIQEQRNKCKDLPNQIIEENITILKRNKKERKEILIFKRKKMKLDLDYNYWKDYEYWYC